MNGAHAQRSAPAPMVTPRLLLLADALDADGLPRPALAIPGQRLPTTYPTLAAALDALRTMEAVR